MSKMKKLNFNDLTNCFKMSVNMEGVKKIEEYISNLERENEELKIQISAREEKYMKLEKQIDYLKSGEYLNQLKFERNMLQDLVDNEKVSEEDKQFIDMIHRNTELLQENETLKIRLNKKKESLRKYLILEVQKKEFMDYLEKERNIYENDIQSFSKDYKTYYLLINELKVSKKKIEEILSKYKEIIGVSSEN